MGSHPWDIDPTIGRPCVDKSLRIICEEFTKIPTPPNCLHFTQHLQKGGIYTATDICANCATRLNRPVKSHDYIEKTGVHRRAPSPNDSESSDEGVEC